MCLGSGTSLRLRAHFKSRLTRVQRQVAKIQESQPGQGRPSKVCAQSDLRCAPLEKSPSARPAAAVAQQTTSRRLRRSWGQTSPEGGAVLEIRRGRPNAGERSAAMTGLVLRPGAGDGCVSLEMRHRLDASPRAERRYALWLRSLFDERILKMSGSAIKPFRASFRSFGLKPAHP